MRLSREEITRILKWAASCDAESYTDDRDWALIERLADEIDADPELVAPVYASDRT